MRIFMLILLGFGWMSSESQIKLIEDDQRSPTDYLADQIDPNTEFKPNLLEFIDIKPQAPIFYLLPNSIEFVKPNLLPIAIDHAPGIFCKMEYKIEKHSRLSPRFRLGSVNYTNWMEGKGEWYTRYWK